jgi:hypothetical protein
MGVVFSFEGVVVGFEFIEFGEVTAHIAEFTDDGVFLFCGEAFEFGAEFLDGAEDFDEEDAMVGDDSAAAFANDGGVGYAFGVADFGGIVDDVVGVFLEGVISGAIEGGAASIVIDGEATADVEELDGEAHFMEFGVESGGFEDGFFDCEDFGDLGADVEVEEFEAVGEVFLFQDIGCGDEFGGAEAEFGIFAGTIGPFSGAFTEEAAADADLGFDAELF